MQLVQLEHLGLKPDSSSDDLRSLGSVTFCKVNIVTDNGVRSGHLTAKGQIVG